MTDIVVFYPQDTTANWHTIAATFQKPVIKIQNHVWYMYRVEEDDNNDELLLAKPGKGESYIDFLERVLFLLPIYM